MSDKGKAARNEQRKLLSTFYNNLAVAFAASGFIVPGLTLYGALTQSMYAGRFGTEEGFAAGFPLAMGAVAVGGIAICGSAVFRKLSNDVAASIED